jgi:hypothetical protein
MPSRTRITRGRKSQEIAADYMRPIWPDGESKGAFLPGVDIENTPGWRVEVKGTRDGTTLAAMKQAEHHAGEGVPIVIWRPDGYGPEKVGQWLVVMRLQDFRGIAKIASLRNVLEQLEREEQS